MDIETTTDFPFFRASIIGSRTFLQVAMFCSFEVRLLLKTEAALVRQLSLLTDLFTVGNKFFVVSGLNSRISPHRKDRTNCFNSFQKPANKTFRRLTF